jgi:hypothetical protein
VRDATQDKLINYLMDRTDRIGDVVKEVAKQLGVAAEHVYIAVVQKEMMYGVAELVVTVPLLFVFLWAARHFLKREKEEFKGGYYGGFGYFISFLMLALMIIDLVVLANGIMHVFAPEYYALKDIMELIKGNTND